jgi:hypothetical protein
MLKIIIKGLRRQLEMIAPQQPMPEIVLPQEQPSSQVEGIQHVDVCNIKSQKQVTREISL